MSHGYHLCNYIWPENKNFIKFFPHHINENCKYAQSFLSNKIQTCLTNMYYDQGMARALTQKPTVCNLGLLKHESFFVHCMLSCIIGNCNQTISKRLIHETNNKKKTSYCI